MSRPSAGGRGGEEAAPLRVALIGNLAGVANEYLRGLRELGVEADLFLSDAERVEMLEDVAEGETPRLPLEWLKTTPTYAAAAAQNGLARLTSAGATLARELPAARALLRYDIVHSHTGSLMAGRLQRLAFIVARRKPYIAAATGSDLREVAREATRRGRWMHTFFAQAERTLLLNIDMPEIAAELGLRNALFFPFAIDVDTFAPAPTEREHGSSQTLLFFMMSRLDWGSADAASPRTSAKNNDRVFRAFGRFIREHPDALLVVSDRGTDREEAKRLVQELGLSSCVRFVPPMSLAERLRLMRMADVCLDQFSVGAYGLGTLECMACAKPLITHVDPRHVAASGLDPLPILSAESIEDILGAMRAARDAQLRARLGAEAREWVVQNHGRSAVCRRLLALYRETLCRPRREA